MKQAFILLVLLGVAYSRSEAANDRATVRVIPSTPGQNLIGNWKVVSFVVRDPASGKSQSCPPTPGNVERHFYGAVVEEKKFGIWMDSKKLLDMGYEVDAKQQPKTIDATYEGRKLLGIYRYVGNDLELRWNDVPQGRPNDFDPEKADVSLDLTPHGGDRLCLMDADGGNCREFLPLYENDQQISPMWSADGKKIAFHTWRSAVGEAGPASSHVFVVELETKSVKDLGPGLMPSWSADGKKITYTKFGPGVCVIDADGKGEEVIERGWCSRWSPKSEEIAFIHYDDDAPQDSNFVIKDMKSGNRRTVLEKSLGFIVMGFAWSPDGQWLAFNCDDKKIIAVNIAGEKKGLKTLFSAEQETGFKSLGTSVSWSADGKQVIAVIQMGKDEHGYLYALDFAGKNPPARLAKLDLSRNYSDPHCSPDGKRIVVASEHVVATPTEKSATEDQK